ncbi:hypothetical protein BDR06DRAFT_973903 [Suillus hirtellus]|nr:hypothetical protein BDR06DRAFT_973903 [Suillus hirtellus]
MTQALSARTQQDRKGAVEQTWRTHKGDDDTSASSPETPRVSGVGREAKADSERNSNVKWLRLQSIVSGKHQRCLYKISPDRLIAPETPRVSGVGQEAQTDSERNLNVKWLRLQSIVLGKHVSGVAREAAADSERIVGIDHCTALRSENERWITR